MNYITVGRVSRFQDFRGALKPRQASEKKSGPTLGGQSLGDAQQGMMNIRE
jgi:hypothetical protein